MVLARSRKTRSDGRLIKLLLPGFFVCCAVGQPTEPPPADVPDTTATPAAVRLTDTGLLDLHVRNLELPTVLEMVSYQAHANIVTSTKVSGTVSANLYSVTLEQVLDAILLPNHFAYLPLDKTIFVGTEDEIRALRPPPITRVFKLRFLRPAEAAKALKAVLAADATIIEGGTEAGGGGSGAPAGGTGAPAGGSSGEKLASDMGPATVDYLIVTDYPDRLHAAEKLLAELDQRPKQVLVEATVLRATLTENNQFGIDFTVLGGVDFQNVNSTSNAGADLQTGALPPNKFQDEVVNVNTNFTSNIGTGGFTLGVINNGVAAFVRALEDVTDVVVIGNPKVVALNKQEADVIVGRRDGYLTTTVTQTAAIQTVEFLETGTQVRFRPIINADGTVRLAVHPKDSNGGLTAANLPFEETTEAHADVLVNDGDTVLIGGLFRERTVGSRSQIPGLGDIPLLGLAFGSRNDQTTREEVIILLTVHILKETPEEQAAQRALADDVELIRVGSRRGLFGLGREPLAQAFFHAALSDMERGRPGLALLNTRIALYNEPTHLAALKLEERLLHKRLWDDEGSHMRTFIWELIRPGVPAPGAPAQGAGPAEPSIFGRPPLDINLIEEGPPP